MRPFHWMQWSVVARVLGVRVLTSNKSDGWLDECLLFCWLKRVLMKASILRANTKDGCTVDYPPRDKMADRADEEGRRPRSQTKGGLPISRHKHLIAI
ncbi:hypothetical protein NPIL_198981 [Nephila pilipes]|uniref:Secreted protein n=1 Tax=Nephila pilipes TaxID=299642 RepID=A0A8X6TND9_NEPPI|nr:hypothetical protein NPIL_198981 [Nephila pilipes]